MRTNTTDYKVPATANVVDNAVGMNKCNWFVAIVNLNSEKQVSEKLTKTGVVNYSLILPDKQSRVWSLKKEHSYKEVNIR